MRDVATRICREYLSGAWKNISQDEIQVKRMSGGLSNFLYYVSLPNKKDTDENGLSLKRTRRDSCPTVMEPTKVLLRIYGQSHGENALETMLTESVVFALLSERQLGPRLHGIFPGGRIEQYIPARSLKTSELSDHQISMKIAEKMGQIHSLHIPVSKEAEWIFNTLNRWFNHIDTIMNDMQNNNNNEDGKYQELQKRLAQIDLRHEANWLRKVAEKEAYPVVFCHNDLQEGNILFREKNFVPPSLVETLDEELHNLDDLSPMLISCPKNKMEKSEPNGVNGNSRKRSLADSNSIDEASSDELTAKQEPELMIIDFEYCAYNYRAFDIANHFLEWTYDYTNDKFPFFHSRPNDYPTAQQIDNFLTTYLANTEGADDKNFVPTADEKKQLLEELSLFTLASHLLWFSWALVNINQEIEFGYLEYAEIRLKQYFEAKQKYLEMKPSAKEFCDMQTRRK